VDSTNQQHIFFEQEIRRVFVQILKYNKVVPVQAMKVSGGGLRVSVIFNLETWLVSCPDRLTSGIGRSATGTD
jgi:hypothetical protein